MSEFQELFAELRTGSEKATVVGERLALLLNHALHTARTEEEATEIRQDVERELTTLVSACLKQVETDDDRAHREQAIRGARAILLLVQNPPQNRFPPWVQELLLAHALGMLQSDCGEAAPRAVDLGRMLAANFAAFRSGAQRAQFADLLRELCQGADEWWDPFIKDRLLIMQRTLGLGREENEEEGT